MPEQLRQIERFTRVMHLGMTVFLAFFLVVAGVIAAVSACALLGVPAGVRFRGPPAQWAAGLTLGLVGGAAGVLFIRFGRGTVDRIARRVRRQADPAVADQEAE